MPTRFLLTRLVIAGVCAAVVACLVKWPISQPEAAAQQPQFPKLYAGVTYCSECHDAKGESRFSRDFCLLNECDIWSNQDKHSQAYEVLTNERSKRMGELMGVDVTKDVRCLACHAVVATQAQQGRDFNIKDGVSCDACHGPSGLWASLHVTLPGWRKLPPEQKGMYGMIDVRDPYLRSKMCLSCHVGSTEEGKVVTHEMYAAGHPPLPGFEIETFVNHEPKHWRYLSEKSDEIQKEFDYDTSTMHRTKLVVIGAVMALRESVNLFGTQAKSLQSEWPDLAQFDCYACHHDLRKPNNSWRLARGFESWRLLENSLVPPGRPQMREWTSVLAIASLLHAGQNEQQLAEALSPLHSALAAQPYGNHEAVSEAAAKVVAWLDQEIAKLKDHKFTKEETQQLLELLARMGADPDHVLDFDSARQLVWAFEVIFGELNGQNADYGELPDGTPDAAKEAFAELGKLLKLKLPSGHESQILQHLPETLNTLNAYDPAAAREQFKRLHEAIAK